MLYSPMPMHIPDGFLSGLVAVIMWASSIGVVGYALRRSGRELGERQLPLLGVLAACIFAGQMLNFPVAGGTSGHLLGATLAAILLGPWAAVVVMTCVVSVQALVFQDGGLLALGANIFNMGVVGVFVAYTVYRAFQRFAGAQRWALLAGGAVAGWASIFIAALACALELALSGKAPANIVIPAMGGIHALIGVGEGLITLGALTFLWTARRDLLTPNAQPAADNKWVWVGGLGLALALTIASPLASTHPDGLEWVAEQKGFLAAMQAPTFNLIPDYVLPGIPNEQLATIAAGVIGVLLVLGVMLVVRRGQKAVALRIGRKQ